MDNLNKMLKGEIEFSFILLLAEVSKENINSECGYFEYNKVIIDAINECAGDVPIAIICDNLI